MQKQQPTRGNGMRMKMRVSTRLSFRYRMAQRTAAATLLASLPFTVGNMLESELMMAKDDKVKTAVEQVDKKIPVTVTSEPVNPSASKYEILASGAGDMVNNGIFYIKSGTTLIFKGTFTNGETAVATINGNVTAQDDWINNGVIASTAGTVTFSGTNEQLISGLQSSSFYNVEVNKTTEDLILGSDVSVANNLVLTRGPVDLNSNRLTLTKSATSALSYSNGFIISEKSTNASKVQWNIGTTTGAHIIPFATSAGSVIPLTVNLISGNMGNLVASTYPTNPDNTPYPVTPDSVRYLTNSTGADNRANTVDRFWQIDRTGTEGTVTLQFTYANAEAPSSGESSLVAQRYNATGDGWVSPAASQSSNAGQNTVTVPNTTAFGVFTIVKNASPLPISLISFDASLADNKSVEMKWVTGLEKNNDFFTIERSRDLLEVETVGTLKGAGNSSAPLTYTYTDDKPYPGISYYRLRQTDFDGTTVSFGWKVIENNTSVAESTFTIGKVYPNPFSNEFTVTFNCAEATVVKLMMFDQTGKQIFTDEIVSTEGENNYVFNKTDNLPPGNYILRLSNGDKVQTVKLIKNQ